MQIVTHMNRGGIETMLMNFYRKIDRNQIQFDFLTHRPYEGDYGEEIKQMGGKIYHLPKLDPFSMSYKRTLHNFFTEHPEYQLIHVHQDCLSSVVLKVAYEHGIKVRIAHSHSSSQDKNLKYPIKLYFKRFISKYATDLFACSDAAGKWMFNGADFTVLNNAIDAEAYKYNKDVRGKMRSVFGIKPNEMLIGHIGRFSPPKNHDFLIDIFNEVQKQTGAKLLLVGEGTLQEQIEKKVKELALDDKVIFAGLRSDVPALLQAMDVFVFPSIYEGLPLSIIEAQASGLPCIISDKVPIECKKTDLVYQLELSKDASEWAEKIVEISDTKRRDTFEEIKAAGFDIMENTQKLLDFYLSAEDGEDLKCLH